MKNLKRFGLILAGASILFNLIETACFGFHLDASCNAERICDVIAVYGLIIGLSVWFLGVLLSPAKPLTKNGMFAWMIVCAALITDEIYNIINGHVAWGVSWGIVFTILLIGFVRNYIDYQKKSESIKGFSITLVFGQWGSISIRRYSSSFRICLGWVALTFFLNDTEAITAYVVRELNKLQNREKAIEDVYETLKDMQKYMSNDEDFLAGLSDDMAGMGENATTQLADKLILQRIEAAINNYEKGTSKQ